MEHLTLLLTSLFPTLATLASVGPREAEDTADITRVLTDYYTAFSTLEAEAFLPYFHQPCLVVSPMGVGAMPTHAALGAALAPVIEGLRAKGYTRSELTMLNVKRLNPGTAIGAGVAVRYQTGNQELERVGVIYVLQRIDNSWKIVVLVTHNADNPLRLQ